MQIFVASKAVEHVSDYKIILQPYHRGLFLQGKYLGKGEIYQV